MSDPAFRRVLLKLSGESLMGDLDYGTDPARLHAVAQQIKVAHDKGVEIAIVLGAGNIFRGVAGVAEGMDRATADYMGMLAIVLNALTLQDALERLGEHTRVLSAIVSALWTRVWTSRPSSASCSVSALSTVASIPM